MGATPFKTMIPRMYDSAKGFSCGLAPVKLDGKWGYIDVDNNTIIPFQFDKANSFYEDVAAVMKDGK